MLQGRGGAQGRAPHPPHSGDGTPRKAPKKGPRWPSGHQNDHTIQEIPLSQPSTRSDKYRILWVLDVPDGTPHTLTLHTLRSLRTLRAAPTRACHAWLGAPLAGATRVRVSTEDGDRRATLAPRPPLAQAGVARGAASRSVTRLGGGARRRPGWPATPEIAPGDEPLERPWHVHVFMMCLWRAYGVTWCLWDAR